MTTIKRLGVLLAAIMLLSGCGDVSISCPPADETTAGNTTTSTTTATTTTAAATTTTTTAVQPTVIIPTARALLGQTYGDFLELTDGVCRVIHAREHTDVALGLESSVMPYYELSESDAAFKDWEQGVALQQETTCPPEAIRTEQIITEIYVKAGGRVTDDLTVGDSVQDWQVHLSSLPEMTILYDFSQGFNKGFYGRIATTIASAKAYLYIDLTTDAATQALAVKGITLSSGDEVYDDPWLGKTVSLPELPVGGVRLWLEDKG